MQEWELRIDLEELLNDIYGEVWICGNSYPAGEVFRRFDEYGFEELLREYMPKVGHIMDQASRWRGSGLRDRAIREERERAREARK